MSSTLDEMFGFDRTEKKLCSCGGKLKWEGVVMTSYPAQYPYTCLKCGKRYIYRIDGTRWEW